MSDESTQPENFPEDRGLDFALKFEPHEPAVRPIWRFLVAAIFVEATDYVALNFASNILVSHPILQDAFYRFSGALILLAGFHFMLRVFDEVEYKDMPTELGFRPRGAVLDFWKGAVISGTLIFFAVFFITVFGGYTFQLHWSAAVLRKSIEVLLLLFVGATYEELSFRGYAFQRLTMAVGPIASIAIFSIWFGAVHLWNPHSGGILSWAFFNTIAVGALFAVAYLRTRALWMPIGLHFGWNFALGTLFGLPVSGLNIFTVMIHGKAYGPKSLTGGSYGLEASALGTAIIVLGILPVLFFTRDRSGASKTGRVAASVL